MIIAANSVNSGLKTAVVESGPLGGTCLNRGCVPSKMLIYPADVVAIIQEAKNLGIKATIESIDFNAIMERMRALVAKDSGDEEASIQGNPDIKWFKDTGEFTSDYMMKVGSETVRANKIFILSGARPFIPPIRGLDTTEYFTSDTVLQLKTRPTSIIIIGGGYIASEYGHFFSRMGTKVTIIQKWSSLVPEEEPEISRLLTEEMSKQMQIYTNHEAVEVKNDAGSKTVVAKSVIDGKLQEMSAENILVAAGRIPNSDLLKPEKTGVKLDSRGFVIVNEFLETGKKNIWACGDAIGKQMFKHVANYEAQLAWHNSVHDHKAVMDYSAAPHAVFSHPQIASVGLREEEARKKGNKILVGTALYRDTAKGAAMAEQNGLVKVIVEHDSGVILGAHVIGPYAPEIIQEIIDAMAVGDKTFIPIVRGMHIHPATPEVVQNAFGNLRET